MIAAAIAVAGCAAHSTAVDPVPRRRPVPVDLRRNENPRLRTLTLAGNVRVELLGGDCEAPLSHKLSELAAHARSGASSNYYALTVTGGAVQRIQELRTGNAC